MIFLLYLNYYFVNICIYLISIIMIIEMRINFTIEGS